MSTDRDDIVKQFCDVTGADEARSKFFLESSNWLLEVALSSFYEHGGNMDEPVSVSPQRQPVPQESSSDTDSPPSPIKKKEKNKRASKNARPGVATLSTLQQEVSSSDEEQGEAFYAGGSERSGQQILDPRKRRDIVTEMFKSVREQGAVSFDDEPMGGRQQGAFSGVGYRLGQTPDDHEPVIQPFRQGSEIRSVRLRLYREGFTVDDGPIREYANPANGAFLACIRRGEIPPELSVTGAEVRVALEDRRNEEGPRRSCMKAAFTGKGHMLGSPTPPTVGEPTPVITPEVTTPDVTTPDETSNIRAAEQAVGLNEALPATTLQIRLADGSRLTARFNHTHTVGDIRRYITTAMPATGSQTFVLMTTFPSTELTDPEVTIEQAKLLNSVVVQRIK